jgi:hypothetical protein
MQVQVLGTFKTVEEKKTFCPNGKVNPQHHFYVDPSKWNETNLIPQLKNGNYPLLIAPSQSGKTTRVAKLVDQLQSKYFPVYIDMLGLVAKVTYAVDFWELLIRNISMQCRVFTKHSIPNLVPTPRSLDFLFGRQDNYKYEYYEKIVCLFLMK